MANDYSVSSLIDDSASPLRANGIDPKDAIKDPDAVMKYLQNRQYGVGIAQPSMLKDNSVPLSASQVPSATAGNQSAAPMDWSGLMSGKPSTGPGTAGSTVSNGQPASDPDLENARALALKAQERTDANQSQWDAQQKQRTDLEAQRAKDAGYIDPHAPTYKPSTGRQVLRGVLGAVSGLAEGGLGKSIMGAINPRTAGEPGYNDPTVQYGRDVARQQATLGSEDQRLKEMKDESKDLYDAGRNLGTDTNANAKVLTDIFTARRNANAADNAAKIADTRQQHEDATEQFNQDRAAVADRNATSNENRTAALVAKLGREPNNGLKGRDAAKVQSYATAHDLDPDSLTPEQLDEALRIGAGPAHVKDRQTFDSHWQTEFQKAQTPFQQERNQIVRRGAVPDVTKNKAAWNDLDKEDQDQITASLNDLENRRTAKNAEMQQEKDAEAQQYGVYGKAAQAASTVSSPAATAKPKSGTVVGAAPQGSREGRTGKLPDGTPVTVKGGKLVIQ